MTFTEQVMLSRLKVNILFEEKEERRGEERRGEVKHDEEKI